MVAAEEVEAAMVAQTAVVVRVVAERESASLVGAETPEEGELVVAEKALVE